MPSDGITRRSIVRTVGAGLSAGAVGLGTATAAGADGAKQEDLRVSVSLYPETPEEYEIAATLTLPPKGKRKPVVQVLIHGITYARYYNDFPYKPDQYSYVQHATEAGYPTLNIDRIGIGESSHPDPELITLDANSWIADQLSRKLKKGEIGGVEFPEVMLVGHSYGSFISTQAQARYGNADYLVLTGFSQSYGQGKPFVAPVQSMLYPARLDDDDDINHLPPGYLTTRPGYRDSFYYEPGTESRVIDIDERNKQTVTDSEFASIPDEGVDSTQVDLPVLEINGDQDSYFCGVQDCSATTGVGATEPSLWPQAEFTFKVIPGVGHDLYLHRRAPEAFEAITEWADERVEGDTNKI